MPNPVDNTSVPKADNLPKEKPAEAVERPVIQADNRSLVDYTATAITQTNINTNITNNVTIHSPPPTPKPANRRSNPARRSTASTPAQAEPSRGFELKAADLNVEAVLAEQNDSGKRNVRVTIEAQQTSYEVSEERRRRPSANQSLQDVGALVDAARPANTHAYVISTHGTSDDASLQTVLQGYANGTVMLVHTQNGRTLRTDITGLDKDITASGVRAMQQQISFDGEVDRFEQQQIIDVVTKARHVAAKG